MDFLLASKKRQGQALRGEWDLLVIDEAHHAAANSYQKVIQHAKQLNPEIRIYGVTASPARGDRKSLRSVFSNVADHVKIGEVIRSGHLVPPRSFVIDLGTQKELSAMKPTGGEFDMGRVALVMDKPAFNKAVVSHWQEKAGDRKTIVFCSTIDHAKHVCQAYSEAGIKAAVISSDLSEQQRKHLLAEFDHGDIQVLLNCFVLTEGYDSQPVSCIVLLRPNSQKSTFIQCIGRGLRTVNPDLHPGVVKEDCIVLDFGTSTLMHGSLEQDIDLDGHHASGEAPHKDCPECDALVPIACMECPICGYEWERSKIAVDVSEGFVMSEVDLFAQSPFRWTDLFGDNASLLATGFDAWAGTFFLDGRWYSVGGARNKRTVLLSEGDRTICIASADDWLNTYESENGAKKSRSWLKQPATPQQLKYLPKQHRQDYGLTRYHASCLIAFHFNKRDIQKTIFHSQKQRESAA